MKRIFRKYVKTEYSSIKYATLAGPPQGRAKAGEKELLGFAA